MCVAYVLWYLRILKLLLSSQVDLQRVQRSVGVFTMYLSYGLRNGKANARDTALITLDAQHCLAACMQISQSGKYMWLKLKP